MTSRCGMVGRRGRGGTNVAGMRLHFICYSKTSKATIANAESVSVL